MIIRPCSVQRRTLISLPHALRTKKCTFSCLHDFPSSLSHAFADLRRTRALLLSLLSPHLSHGSFKKPCRTRPSLLIPLSSVLRSLCLTGEYFLASQQFILYFLFFPPIWTTKVINKRRKSIYFCGSNHLSCLHLCALC